MNQEIIITFISKDQPGLIHRITDIIAKQGVNIVDIDQSVVRGIFSIILVCDPSTSELDTEKCFETIKASLEKVKSETSGYLLIDFNKLETKKRVAANRYIKVTVLGKDAPGIVAKISGIVFNYHYNIENVQMISRKDIFAMDVMVSHPDDKETVNRFKKTLKESIDSDDLSVIIQDENIFSEEKKLVVFDMDSTLIQQECINELGSALNLKERIAKITEDAMNGKIDFKDALKKRVGLLKGVEEAFLKKVADNLSFTPGAKELVDSLKKMGYKIALVSGGFSYFTNIVKEKLGLDYAFGNELIIEDGKLTGEINENFIIDANQKAKIQKWLAQIEGIPPKSIVCIGDGANDRIMIQNSGLGIGFRPKKILKSVADGIINEENLIGILYALGDLKKRKFQEQNNA
ncbi:MAG: phosphoserine phosphatase SerB [Candidatus Hodarchaeota archaeon]